MNDGGPAFPTHLEDQFIPIPGGGMGRAKEYGWESKPGMSLRDWFAGQALGAFCCHTDKDATTPDVAWWAYQMADAMLAARERKETP